MHLRDAVGTAAQRRLEGGGLEVAILPVVLRQHREFAEAHDEQRIVRLLEDEADAVAVEDVDALHALQVGAVLRVAVLDQEAVGEGDVVCRDGLAVMEAGFLAQVEYHPAVVVAVLHRFGNQSITGRGFVAGWVVQSGADHQRFVQLTDAVLQETGRGARAGAFEGVGVERVEGA